MTGARETVALVLAAGKGTRMKSELPKVLFPIQGRPLIHHVLDAVGAAGFTRTVVVVGYEHQRVRDELADRGVEFALQAEQLGTGHAVMMAAPLLSETEGDAVVIAGDVPLIRPETLRALLDRRRETGAAVVVLTANLPDASGYGRILRDETGGVTAIVEHKDATETQRQVREINSSIYAFDILFLLDCLPRLNNDNRQGEYYLTDTVAMAVAAGRRVEAMVVEDFQEVSGVNTTEQLAAAGAALRGRQL